MTNSNIKEFNKSVEDLRTIALKSNQEIIEAVSNNLRGYIVDIYHEVFKLEQWCDAVREINRRGHVERLNARLDIYDIIMTYIDDDELIIFYTNQNKEMIKIINELMYDKNGNLLDFFFDE